MNESFKRIASAIIGGIILIAVLIKGGIYLNTGILIISLIGLREFYVGIRRIGIKPLVYIGYLAAFMIYMSNLYPSISIEFILTFTIILSLIIYLFSKKISLKGLGATFVGILYIPLLFSYINLLENTVYIWLIFIISFGTDTFAYLGGKYFGKRKLWPEISPNKTIEGSVSGIIGSVILTIIFSIYTGTNPRHLLVILTILASIFSQVGDLVASKIKRTIKLKDFGNIMPGHGGVLDRFDSIIFGAPIIYYYVNYFLK